MQNPFAVVARFYSQALSSQHKLSTKAAGAFSVPFSTHSPPQYNVEQYYQANERISWLYAVVDRIALSVASVKWHMYTVPKSIGDRREEIFDHELLDMLAHVNPFETWNEHMELSQQFMELAGESFWVIVYAGKTPSELWTINPLQMQVIPHRENYIAGYVYSNQGELVPLDREQVIHIKRPNPRNRYRGLSPVAPVLTDLESHYYSSLWQRAFFRNSATPGGVIQVPDTLTDDQFERLRLQWEEEHQGIANSHRVAILEGGAQWHERAFNMRDLQFERLRKDTRDTILANYGVPQHVLGISENVNRANAEAGEYIFSRWVIQPRLVRIREKLNEQLVPLFDKKGNIEIDFDDPVPENRDFKLGQSERSWKAGIITKNEARELQGYSPDPDNGEVYLLSSSSQEVPKDRAEREKMEQEAAAAAAPSTAKPDKDAQDDEPKAGGEEVDQDDQDEEFNLDELFSEKAHTAISRYLRYGEETPGIRSIVLSLDKAFDVAPKLARPRHVYRTLYGEMSDFSKGDMLYDPDFVIGSQALHRSYDGAIVVRIDLPKGYCAITATTGDTVLARCTTFRVDQVISTSRMIVMSPCEDDR